LSPNKTKQDAEPQREAETPVEVDSAGVYFLSREDFEARTPPSDSTPAPASNKHEGSDREK